MNFLFFVEMPYSFRFIGNIYIYMDRFYPRILPLTLLTTLETFSSIFSTFKMTLVNGIYIILVISMTLYSVHVSMIFHNIR